jgi:hypothetical protein
MLVQAFLRGVGREKTRRQQKSVSLYVYVPHDKSNQSTILLFLYCMFFSVCTGMLYIFIACLTEYEECEAFCLFVPLRLANTAFVNFLCVSLEIYGIPYMKKVTEFREIPRNFTELYVTEFGGISPELQPIPHGIRNRRK